jgi:hypothetical protein
VFHLLAYFSALGVNAANSDLTAVADGTFSTRNGHFILSERYNLLWWAHLAANATAARLNVPHINAIARHHLWPVTRGATPPSPPRGADYRDYPIELPMSEEIAVEASNNLGAATEDSTSFLCIAPKSWTRIKPRGLQQLTVRPTAAVATVADNWSLFGNLTFPEQLRGGWYALCGARCQSANIRAFRLNFPKSPMLPSGRKLFPGSLSTAALGNQEWPPFSSEVGVWGVFHSFELPQLQVYGDAAGADTQVLSLDLVYLTDSDNFTPLPGTFSNVPPPNSGYV